MPEAGAIYTRNSAARDASPFPFPVPPPPVRAFAARIFSYQQRCHSRGPRRLIR